MRSVVDCGGRIHHEIGWHSLRREQYILLCLALSLQLHLHLERMVCIERHFVDCRTDGDICDAKELVVIVFDKFSGAFHCGCCDNIVTSWLTLRGVRHWELA
jgi:hypothetical protein